MSTRPHLPAPHKVGNFSWGRRHEIAVSFASSYAYNRGNREAPWYGVQNLILSDCTRVSQCDCLRVQCQMDLHFASSLWRGESAKRSRQPGVPSPTMTDLSAQAERLSLSDVEPLPTRVAQSSPSDVTTPDADRDGVNEFVGDVTDAAARGDGLVHGDSTEEPAEGEEECDDDGWETDYTETEDAPRTKKRVGSSHQDVRQWRNEARELERREHHDGHARDGIANIDQSHDVAGRDEDPPAQQHEDGAPVLALEAPTGTVPPASPRSDSDNEAQQVQDLPNRQGSPVPSTSGGSDSTTLGGRSRYPDFCIVHDISYKMIKPPGGPDDHRVRSYNLRCGRKITHRCVLLIEEDKRAPSRQLEKEKTTLVARIGEAHEQIIKYLSAYFYLDPNSQGVIARPTSGPYWHYLLVKPSETPAFDPATGQIAVDPKGVHVNSAKKLALSKRFTGTPLRLLGSKESLEELTKMRKELYTLARLCDTAHPSPKRA